MSRRVPLLAALAAALLLAPAGRAAAQGPVYGATPPTAGAPYRDGPDHRYLLGGGWLLRQDPGDVGLSGGWWQDQPATDGWTPTAVPASFNAGETLDQASMAGSVAWYRRDFTLPDGAFAPGTPAREQCWIVRFESVNYRASVWLNGRLLARHTGAYLPFELDLKGLRPGVNRLIVRVDSRRGPGDLPPGPGGGWWNFGGINREVLLRSVTRVDLPQVLVRPVLPCPGCAAKVRTQVTLRNLTGRAQAVILRGRYGSVALAFPPLTLAPHAVRTVTALATVPRPRLWSPDRPYLYRAALTLSGADGRQLGGYSTFSGIRQIHVTPGGRLTLNGRLLNLRGFNLHEQDPGVSGVLDQARTAQLLNWVRELGGTVIRSHYPLSPELQELADREGLLIWSEIPVYQIDTELLSDPSVMAHARDVLRTDIQVNGNHPSVLLWSIANELTTPADAAETQYIAAAAAEAHALDPSRPVGMAVSYWPGVDCQKAYAPLDVIGFNDYFGWFDAGGGTTDDRDQLSPFLDNFRACYPTKAILITEFGVEGSRPGPVEERGTYQFQSDAAAYHLGVYATKRWLSGAIWFPLQDFAARPGWSGGDPSPHPPWVEKGPFDRAGNPKPVASILSASYHATRQIGPPPGR